MSHHSAAASQRSPAAAQWSTPALQCNSYHNGSNSGWASSGGVGGLEQKQFHLQLQYQPQHALETQFALPHLMHRKY